MGKEVALGGMGTKYQVHIHPYPDSGPGLDAGSYSILSAAS